MLITTNVIMKGVLLIILAFCALFQCAQSIKYSATVVEYASMSAEANTILMNLDNYIKEIERSNSDIIVFPEYGLTTIDVFGKTNWKKDYTLHVPKSYEDINLCDATDHVEKALKDVSCVAKKKKIYVVINFVERDNSTAEELFYNTNLVFDRSGKIVAKYHKINLYHPDEDPLTPGKDVVTFESDFGVKFGIITCFDILSKNPASDILTDGINDIIFVANWISLTPFVLSLSVQAGYAKKNKVNLLASGYNNPSATRGGSGIYSGDGVTATTYVSGEHKTETISLNEIDSIARAKTCDIKSGVKPTGGKDKSTVSTLQNFATHRTPSKGYTFKYKTLSTKDKDIKDEICLDSFCCKFAASVMNKLSTDTGTYKWAVIQRDGTSMTSCALLFCKTSEDASCGERINQDTKATFTRISISGNFPKNQYIIPITSKIDLKPIYAYSYCSKDTGSDKKDITMEINEDQVKDVTVFGIAAW